MTNPLDHLKPFALDKLDSLDLAELAQPWESTYSTGVYGQSIDLDASCRTIQPISRIIDATGIDSMATAIGTLPEPTESVHMWIGGKHSLGHLLPAVLQLANPATITAAAIATLTFSKSNAEEWADLIDHGQLANLTVVTSVYFEKTSANIFDYATGLLRPRGADVFTLRCHAKLACLHLSDGRTITAESSSNTRSAKTLEQLTIFGSPAVYAFHTDQIRRGREMQGFEFTGANRKG